MRTSHVDKEAQIEQTFRSQPPQLNSGKNGVQLQDNRHHNPTMLEVRKRPMSPDNLGPSQKKRIITASGSSKAVSGSNKSNPDDDDEPQGHDLEVYIV